MSDHKPISPDVTGLMNKIGRVLGIAFAPASFVLLVFVPGVNRVNYISSGPRKEMIASMKNFIERMEAEGQKSPLH